MKLKFITILLLTTLRVSAQLVSSNLPIIIINTQNVAIKDEPKTLVDFKIIYNGEGKLNKITDLPIHYNGFAGIETRGSSSQGFPKKPYGLELRTKDGLNNPQALVGMPKGSDWILFASYNEKSLMHNVLTLSLGRRMGIYASRTKYVEVVINDDYKGVYVLMEKIKQDKDRLDIADLKPEDIAGDQLTGGYIIKIDKGTGTNIGTFKSKYPNDGGNPSTYFYDTPKDINTQQKAYIKDYITKFEDSFFTADYKHPEKGYRKYVNIQSFVKMFLLNEVSRNVDGYRISSYMHKDKDSKGGKLNAGPPWDFDISYGNANYCEGNRYDLFAYKFNQVCPTDFWLVPFFWDKMVADPYFIGELRNTYFKERKPGGILDLTRMYYEIDSMATVLKDAQKRNFIRWPIIGTYVWPSPQPFASTYEGEVFELKNWIGSRLLWLDANMPKEFIITANEIPTSVFSVKAFPNPFIDRINLKISSQKNTTALVTLHDISGKQVFEETIDLKAGENEKELNLPSFQVSQSINFLKIKTKEGEIKMSKMLKVQ
jgi:hypothetical protein